MAITLNPLKMISNKRNILFALFVTILTINHSLASDTLFFKSELLIGRVKLYENVQLVKFKKRIVFKSSIFISDSILFDTCFVLNKQQQLICDDLIIEFEQMNIRHNYDYIHPSEMYGTYSIFYRLNYSMNFGSTNVFIFSKALICPNEISSGYNCP
jgi:hypothetical protein